jgi:hypothetical protein
MPTTRPSDLVSIEDLKAEHRALDLRLAQLQRHISLSPDEQVESARLKKLKLATKDLIAQTARLARR